MWILVTLLLTATPDRAALVDAWEGALGRDATLTVTEDGYHLSHPDLGYDGPVTLVATRVSEYPGDFGVAVSHQGIVDFRLEVDEELAESVVYYSWLASLQNFYFLAEEQRWVDQAEFNGLMTAGHDPFGGWFLLRTIAGPLLLLGLLLAALFFVGRQMFRAKGLMSDSFDINRMARSNIEEANRLQAEQRALQEEVLALARRQVELLEEIRDRLDSR